MTMRYLSLLLLLVACQKETKSDFRASCKPNATLDGLDCVVENVGKKAGRACVTAREQPPKVQPIVAKRVCTKSLAPGEKQSFKPKFDRVESLQPICSPEGTWVCKDEIVEQQHELGDNIPKS